MGCPPRVEGALEKVAGVEGVDVDFETKTVKVTCGKDTNPEALVAALEGAGFGGSVQD